MTTTHLAQAQDLLSQCASITLDDNSRTFFRKLRSDKQAQDEGDTIHSSVVLDEFVRVTYATLPLILASKIPGYGPIRAKYLIELGVELATHVHTYDHAMAAAAGSGASSTTNLKGSRNLRKTALRILKNLAGEDAEARARVKQLAEKRGENPDERTRSLERIADELDAVVAKLSPVLVADAGISPELIAGLRLNAKAVTESRDTARDTRGDTKAQLRVMNILDGRILFELRALIRAARDANKVDPTLPIIRSARVQRLSRPRKPQMPAPEGKKID